MIVFKRALPRRTLLRGAGAALALPLLDAMVPAVTAGSRTAAAAPRRFCAVYAPNGMAMNYWTPATEGAGFEFTPVLKPLEPYRDYLNVISGLQGPDGGNHAAASTGFLTGVGGESTATAQLAATSVDQIIARELAAPDQLGSLELGLDGAATGTCDGQISCTLTNTISWRTPTTPLPMETNPRAVFERMFGDQVATDERQRAVMGRQERSVLDSVRAAAADLRRRVGPSDRLRMDEYLEAVRDSERRIQRAEHYGKQLTTEEQPVAVPDSYDEHARMMFRLQLLALRTDLTRVTTFMLGREFSGRTYPQIGVPDAHHPLSHHGENPELVARMSKVNTYHTALFAEFVKQLRETADGDGSLLDHTLLLYGAGMSDSNSHDHSNLPLVLLGGGSSYGRHLVYRDVPSGRLFATMLDRMGVPTDRLTESDRTARLEGLAGL